MPISDVAGLTEPEPVRCNALPFNAFSFNDCHSYFMTPNPAQTPMRTLRPVAPHFDKGGAATVPLSPTRGLRNASIIYEKIKDMPAQTAIRADYDRQGKPYLYFPRTQKLSRQTARDLLEAANLQADRQEALNILLVIAQEAQLKSDVSQEARLAALRFGLKVRERNLVGDIRVGDVRDALAVINGVERAEEGGQGVRRKGAVLRAQLANFIGMPGHLKEILAIALETGRTSGHAASGSAVEAMFTLVREFLDEQPRGDARAFLSHVGHYPLSPELVRFAWQWRKLKQDRHTTAGFLFRQLPWARHIDFAARIIKFIAQRVGRWEAPARRSEQSLRSSSLSLPVALSEAAVSGPPAAGTIAGTVPADRGRGQRESQRALVSLPKEEASSDIEVRSPVVRRDESRIRPFQSPHAESSDLRVLSPLREAADAAASSRSPSASLPSAPSSVASRAKAADEALAVASESDTSWPSLLDKVEWIPLGDSESASDPTV